MNKEIELAEQTNMKIVKKEELIKRDKIIGTPFEIITVDEGCFIALGSYRLSDYEDEEECIRKIVEKDWDFLMSVINVFIENLKTETK